MVMYIFPVASFEESFFDKCLVVTGYDDKFSHLLMWVFNKKNYKLVVLWFNINTVNRDEPLVNIYSITIRMRGWHLNLRALSE